MTPNRPATSSGYHGEDADERALLADEAEMGRELSERYFREPGLRQITTQVRQFQKQAEQMSDAPRSNQPWRRG